MALRLYLSTCAVSKGALFQQERVLPRERSSRPSYPSCRGGNVAVGAWVKEMATGRGATSLGTTEGSGTGELGT